MPSLSFLWTQNASKHLGSGAKATARGLRYAVHKIIPTSDRSHDSSNPPTSPEVRERLRGSDGYASSPGLGSQAPRVSEGDDAWRARVRKTVDEKLIQSRIIREAGEGNRDLTDLTAEEVDHEVDMERKVSGHDAV